MVLVLASLNVGEEIRFVMADYDEVRALQTVQVTSSQQTNEQIAQSVFEDAALDWAVGQLPAPTSGTRSATNLRRQKRAALYRCAGLIAPSVPQLLRETLGGISNQFVEIPFADKQQELFSLALSEVEQVRRDEGLPSNSDRDPKSYTFFLVVGGSR